MFCIQQKTSEAEAAEMFLPDQNGDKSQGILLLFWAKIKLQSEPDLKLNFLKTHSFPVLSEPVFSLNL